MVGLPVPTHWIDVDESPPPEDVWLFLYVHIPKEEAEENGAPPPIMCGYFSGRYQVFLDHEFRCISEIFDVTMYSVATLPGGGVIEVGRR